MKTISQTLAELMASKQVTTGIAVRFWSDHIAGHTWCFTTLPASVTIGDHTFTPLALKLDTRTGGDGSAQVPSVTLEMEPCEPFATFGNPRLGIQFKALVYEVFGTLDGQTVAYDLVAEGMVVFSKRTASSLSLSIKPLVGVMERRVPCMVYSRTDQRTPYSADFGVDPSTRRVAAVVDAIEQNVIFSTALASFAEGWFSNGFIAYDVTQSGITVTVRVPVIASGVESTGQQRAFVRLAYPPPMLAAADSVWCYFGYDGTREMSQSSKFNNFFATEYQPASNGFIGFPDMPVENPVVTPLPT